MLVIDDVPTNICFTYVSGFHNSAAKIQISNSTNMILDMQGGFLTKERGGIDVKVKLEILTSFIFIFYMLMKSKKFRLLSN